MVDLTITGNNANRDCVAAYLAERIKSDKALADACQKPNKTIDGVLAYMKQEAEKLITGEKRGMVCVMIPDNDRVWNWAVDYILEDELDCEVKEEPKPKYEPKPLPQIAPERAAIRQLEFVF